MPIKKTLSPLRQRAHTLWPPELEPGRGSNNAVWILEVLCLLKTSSSDLTVSQFTPALVYSLYNQIYSSISDPDSQLAALCGPDTETEGLLKCGFSSCRTWSSAVYWPRMSNQGAIKKLTCRYPAGLPLEKGVGNYIAFRLIRHSCQI